ncbi:sugar-transfer associated ATP-grasp domain-containing protein [Fodinibius sediminis]|nr:sugar-transfer associated ATP-grasp domain-containing protein [Fodinibius sediminis]
MNRAIYLGYYLKKLDREKFRVFLNHASKLTGKPRTAILSDVVRSVFTYNISILEYFQFGFFDLSQKEREQWAGTGYMYEYQLRMNPRNDRHILEDKTLFYKHYGDFFVHRVADIETIKNQPEIADEILANPSGRLVFKSAEGNCGTDVEIKRCSDFNRASILDFMEKRGFPLVEEFIEQHPQLNRLSPSAVNTVRIFTQLDDRNEVVILGCRLRISVNSPVDNMAAGNLAAPIDETTGQLSGPAVYSDITKEVQECHPVTKVKIPGFQIPYWEETLEMVKKAALHRPQNRSIGWDVVITEKGPGLIEGNHDWCKLLWQLPVRRGMKSALKEF